MSKTITNILKTSGLGNKTIAIKKLLSTKAVNEVRSSFPSIKKDIANKYINETKSLKESSVYDSVIEYAKNSNAKSLTLPNGMVLNVKFNDKTSGEVSIEDAKMITNAMNKLAEPVVKQQLITQMDLSAGMFDKVKSFLRSI